MSLHLVWYVLVFCCVSSVFLLRGLLLGVLRPPVFSVFGLVQGSCRAPADHLFFWCAGSCRGSRIFPRSNPCRLVYTNHPVGRFDPLIGVHQSVGRIFFGPPKKLHKTYHFFNKTTPFFDPPILLQVGGVE